MMLATTDIVVGVEKKHVHLRMVMGSGFTMGMGDRENVNDALTVMINEARQHGADAIVGIKIEFGASTGVAFAYGTAIKFAEPEIGAE